MDDTQRILKCGNLSLHTPGGFFKKRWHRKYLVLYDGSKSGVKRLELFDSEIKFKKQNPAKIIPLVDCVRVVTCQRNKSTYTFEVRTNDHFYLLAAQSFQDMNDWVNCLRLVAFGQPQPALVSQPPTGLASQQQKRPLQQQQQQQEVDVLLDQKLSNRKVVASAMGGGPLSSSSSLLSAANHQPIESSPVVVTASQAAVAAASALAKTRQRQPSLLGSCKPLPPSDSPFASPITSGGASAAKVQLETPGQLDTLTPTVRGQLIAAAAAKQTNNQLLGTSSSTELARKTNQQTKLSSLKALPESLDEEEENMLYCSIEDNPSEHNYRVKVIETELSLRCQLKCYQLATPTSISQQYEQFGRFNQSKGRFETLPLAEQPPLPVTFYQLIIGPQELTLLNDYYAVATPPLPLKQQQGLWSWPYQCIRRYGFDKDNCFMFEAGRKCTSGPGQFIVQTPKAYQIYQDVVKFVNELRSLTDATGSVTAAPANQPQQPSSNTITQIPVSWTPLPLTTTEAIISGEQPSKTGVGGEQNRSAGSRAHFFDALRQLDSTNNHQPAATNEKPQTEPSTEQPKKSLKLQQNLPAKSVTPEETDESGYEQGDESVDSNSMARPGLAKRPLASQQAATGTGSDSMSSASSTSSSSCAGSPGHSVGRRSGNSLEGATITKRPAIDTRPELGHAIRKSPAKMPLKLAPEEDFEASLIRDVYSEITKLHAKFAVVSGSGDDSMSSSSSSSSSSGSSCGTNSSDLQELPEGPGRTRPNRKSALAGEYQLEPEPMYTNLNANRPFNSYSQNPGEYLYNRLPICSPYPTVLNPIPEEERPVSQQAPKVAPKPAQLLSSYSRSNSNLNSKSNLSNLNYPGHVAEMKSRPNNNNNNCQQQPTSGLNTKSKLPTNHYVINDVQYAKISRNIRKNFESFL